MREIRMLRLIGQGLETGDVLPNAACGLFGSCTPTAPALDPTESLAGKGHEFLVEEDRLPGASDVLPDV